MSDIVYFYFLSGFSWSVSSGIFPLSQNWHLVWLIFSIAYLVSISSISILYFAVSFYILCVLFCYIFSSLLREILGSLIFNHSAFLRCTFKALHFLLEAQMEKIYLSGWSQIGTQKVSHHHHRSYYPVSVVLRLANTVSSSLAF